jgi:PAS domain S-box-containing protein
VQPLEAERYKLLVERVTDYAIYMLDIDGIITTWNAGAERIKGYKTDEILGQNFGLFYTPEDRAAGKPRAALETAAREGKFEAEQLRVRKDGSRFWAHIVLDPLRDDAGRLIGYAKITRDITERVQAREELERTRAALGQSQKMEAIGQLAGGIAHDLNNVLTAVIGNLDLLQRAVPVDNERGRALLAAAIQGAEGGAALVSKLLAFSRRQILAPTVTDLNKLVASAAELLRSAVGETVKLEVVQAGGLWRAVVDAALMESALLNLALNARDAMAEGGLLTIETANAFLDDDYARAHAVAPGQYVLVAVSDTGQGMDGDTISRAFEPFFTTKEVGRGSGLGLSQVYGFVKQSTGHIKLYSELGRGTTVKMYLPRLPADVQAEVTAPAVRASTPAGTELILVVEDNPDVRMYMTECLSLLGYRTLAAEGAEGALLLVTAHDDIALILTDVVLPGMNGRALAEEARRRRPGMKVLFTSGYTQNAIVHHGRLDPGVSFLAKPFKLDALGLKIREVLDAD